MIAAEHTGWPYFVKKNNGGNLYYCPGRGPSQQGVLSPAFDRTFDHLQLIRATLIFKMQKKIYINKSTVFILIYFRKGVLFQNSKGVSTTNIG